MASKRGNQGEGYGGAHKKLKMRRADVSGFCPETIMSRLTDMNTVLHKGEWRRSKVICIPFRQTGIKLTHILSSKVYVMKAPTPVGMTDLMIKLQSAYNRYWRSIPSLVVEYFDINKENYQTKDYSVSVSFSGKLLIFYSVMFSFTLIYTFSSLLRNMKWENNLNLLATPNKLVRQ